MIIVADSSDLPRITNPAIRELVALRIRQLNSSDDLDVVPTEFIVIEAGDPAQKIEQAAGFPILTGLFDDLPYTDPDFQPCHELLEEHQYEQHKFYEMVFISDDDGAATAIFIPDTEGVDNNLLALCRSWATSAAVSTP